MYMKEMSATVPVHAVRLVKWKEDVKPPIYYIIELKKEIWHQRKFSNSFKMTHGDN